MHLELALPALRVGRSPGRRLPALELVLARARARRDAALTPEGWLMHAFGAPGPCPAGALTHFASGGEAEGSWWMRADPVHLLQRREMLVLAPPPAIEVRADEAQALAQALSVHFGSAFAVGAEEPARWCARLDAPATLDALAPLEAAGRNVDAMLPGGEARRWHALLNEVQMLLHAHPVNAAREARGERPVNSLWLWGGGTLPVLPQARWHSVAADDPVALGLARRAGAREGKLPEGAAAWLARLPEDGRHLALLDALRAPHAFDDARGWAAALARIEEDWFAPLLAALRGGRVDMLTLHLPDGAERTSHELVPGDLRRFWRRPKPVDGA